MFNPQELEGKDAGALHMRRAEIISEIQALPKSYEDAPTELLQELAFIAGALRRKTSGPPKVAKPSRSAKKPTVQDIIGAI
jgi:hypothetical protein